MKREIEVPIISLLLAAMSLIVAINRSYADSLSLASITSASTNSANEIGNAYSGNPVVSQNGRFILFHSTATNFADTNNTNFQIYRKDMLTGEVMPVMTDRNEATPSHDDVYSEKPTVKSLNLENECKGILSFDKYGSYITYPYSCDKNGEKTLNSCFDICETNKEEKFNDLSARIIYGPKEGDNAFQKLQKEWNECLKGCRTRVGTEI